jgi:predicted enzyme related to lactoylglutathione lyase
MILSNGQFRVMFTPENYEASVAFYRDGLQLPVDHDWDFGGGDRGTVFIAGGGLVELLGYIPGTPFTQPQGIILMMQVEDADRAHQAALERYLNVLQEPTTYPWGHRVLRLTDPDGIVVSLFAVVESK